MGGNLSSPIATTTYVGDNNNVGAFNLHQGRMAKKGNTTDDTAETLQELGLENLHLRGKLDTLQTAFWGFAFVSFVVCAAAFAGWIISARRARRLSRPSYYQRERSAERVYLPARGSRDEKSCHLATDTRMAVIAESASRAPAYNPTV